MTLKRKESLMKKILCLCLALITLALPLVSCSKDYADDVSVDDLRDALEDSLTGTVPEYSLADKGYLDDYFTIPDYVSDYVICFSTPGDNLDEFGIFHVTEDNADDLKDKLEDYLSDSYDQNLNWYNSYMPEETPKLRDAEVKVFGNYVVYTVLSDEDAKAAFEAVENKLKK